MRFFAYFLLTILIFTSVNSKEFRIDLSDEGMKLLKKRGFGKKTQYTNGKDENGWFIKAVADSSATGLGLEIKNKDLLKKMPIIPTRIFLGSDYALSKYDQLIQKLD